MTAGGHSPACIVPVTKKYTLRSLGRSIQQRSLMQDTRCSHRGKIFPYWMSLNPESERKVRTKWLAPSKRGGESVWPLGEGTTINVFPQTIFIGPFSPHTSETPSRLLESRSVMCSQRPSGSPICGKERTSAQGSIAQAAITCKFLFGLSAPRVSGTTTK